MADYNAAHGVTLESSDMASIPAFLEIPGIVDGPDGGGYTAETIEAFPHSETTVVRKTTKVTPTPITFGLLYDSSDTTHARLLTDMKAKTVRNYRLTSTDAGAEVVTFPGQVTQFDRSNNSEDWSKISVTITPTEAYTEA